MHWQVRSPSKRPADHSSCQQGLRTLLAAAAGASCPTQVGCQCILASEPAAALACYASATLERRGAAPGALGRVALHCSVLRLRIIMVLSGQSSGVWTLGRTGEYYRYYW